MAPRYVEGILLIYHHALVPNAETIREHIDAFSRYSRFPVWEVNTQLGFPRGLAQLEFQVVVLHYSLFGSAYYQLNRDLLNYLKTCQRSHKVAFFQDEYYYCQQRFRFLNEFNIDRVYTLLAPAYWDKVYRRYTQVVNLHYTVPGLVSESLLTAAARFALPWSQRSIDVGYRGRELPYYMGKGAQEKTWIAHEFLRRCSNRGLVLDIETREEKRIYGEDWYRFTGNCKFCLGVEAGVSIFDLEDQVRHDYEQLVANNQKLSFKEVYERILYKWEGNIPYRTISPRHFEAAAFRTGQILFEGDYSGILKPWVHYLPLKKDFSNIEEIMKASKDSSLCQEIIENAYHDLIISQKYTYREFIAEFDAVLVKEGIHPPRISDKSVTDLLRRGEKLQLARARVLSYLYRPFPGREILKKAALPVIKGVRHLAARRNDFTGE